MPRPPVIRFGVFEFDAQSGELRKQGRKVRLAGQPVQVLAKLLERPGELVTREELQKQLWADTFVNFEPSINAAVKRLRRALGDNPANAIFVETLARRGYRFIAPVAAPGAAGPPGPAPLPAIGSLAVLPFENAGADPEAEYLSDGITESIISNLSQLPSVRVMARSTVFRYKDKTVDPRAVGRKLNVQALLLGRVLQRGDALLIATELVDVPSGWQLWGEQYNRGLADLLAVEAEISREISEKLRLHLSGEDRTRLAKRPTASSDAYQDYLRGRYHWNRLTEEGLRQSCQDFQRAIQKDPGYALAHAGLADAYSLMGLVGLQAPGEVMPLGKEAALRALALDDGLAEAHAALAGILKLYDWDWPAAEQGYQRALTLNPNYVSAHRGYAAWLAAGGRSEEALREMQQAHELDPLSLAITMETAWNLYMAREYDRAIEYAGRTIELEPQFSAGHHVLGLAYEQKKQYGDARSAFETAATASESHPSTLAGLARALALCGRRNEAARILEQLRERSRRSYVSAYWPALVHAGLQDQPAALGCLEQACEQRDAWLVWLRTDPRLDNLRAEPRFERLLRRVGLLQGMERAAG